MEVEKFATYRFYLIYHKLRVMLKLQINSKILIKIKFGLKTH